MTEQERNAVLADAAEHLRPDRPTHIETAAWSMSFVLKSMLMVMQQEGERIDRLERLARADGRIP